MHSSMNKAHIAKAWQISGPNDITRYITALREAMLEVVKKQSDLGYVEFLGFHDMKLLMVNNNPMGAANAALPANIILLLRRRV